jgi:hypothetical protein
MPRRGDFTILDLARALKVTPAAIYHHVEGRAEIDRSPASASSYPGSS